MSNSADFALYEKIYTVVQQVPPGSVASYGDIAAVVGGGCDARMVGVALGELKERGAEVPWQRVVNREGGISTRGLRQRELLEAEGVEFDARERVVLARFRWPGPGTEWATANGFHTLPPRDDDRAEQLSLF